mmetsp:Transcript_32/g.139  ORF Transcript_32/g.139 Transcript_32/m.139 type:complete len:246 (-) Transcript_32:646-1383(-)
MRSPCVSAWNSAASRSKTDVVESCHMRSCCSLGVELSPKTSVAMRSATSAMARMRSENGLPLSSMLPKSAMSERHAAMNLGGSTSGPPAVFCSSAKPNWRASLGSNARRSSRSRASAESARSRARSSFFSGSPSPTLRSSASRHLLARLRINSAACAPAGPAAAACWRFASRSSRNWTSIASIAAISATFSIILAGVPMRTTACKRFAAMVRRCAASVLIASTTAASWTGSAAASRLLVASWRSE